MKMRKILFVMLICVLTLTLIPVASLSNALDPIIGDGTSYIDFIEIMKIIKSYGDQTAEAGFVYQSEYYYSLAGAGVSSLRFAAENVLWLKGEGQTFKSFVAESHYTSWDEIAEINYASPYPYYFEGLIYQFQGMLQEAIDPYANASVMYLFPEEGLDFYYLRRMSIEALYALRDELRALEDEIYDVYWPEITGYTRNYMNFSSEYLRALSKEAGEAGRYSTALAHAKVALRNDPFDVMNWQNAAICALYAENWPLMGSYIDEGLAIFPDDEGLNILRQAIKDAMREIEGAM